MSATQIDAIEAAIFILQDDPRNRVVVATLRSVLTEEYDVTDIVECLE